MSARFPAELAAFEKMLLREFDEILTREPDRAPRPVLVVNEQTGGLTQTLLDRGFTVRAVQDSAAGLTALQNALNTPPAVPTAPGLAEEILRDVATVLYRLPRPQAALAEISWNIARHAAPDVIFLAAARTKDLQPSMNATLAQHFGTVRASLGAFKSRALVASEPRPAIRVATAIIPPGFPQARTEDVAGQQLHLRAHGLTFGSARLDPGTRTLLETLWSSPTERAALTEADRIIDLGCGNGTVAAFLALATTAPHILATDDSYSAIASTRATLKATLSPDQRDRVQITHQDGLADTPDHSADAILFNPPFHAGNSAITTELAYRLFDDAARVLKPGGRLYTVWNSMLRYRSALESRVGPTHQLARTSRFTVTVSTVD